MCRKRMLENGLRRVNNKPSRANMRIRRFSHHMSDAATSNMTSEPSQYENEISRVVDRLRCCRSILFVTGAGVSADSGLPTYRGVGGMYDVDTTAEGYPIEEILSGEMLRQNPALTWKYLLEIGNACRGATFNRAHEIMADAEQYFERVWVLTQNVDGFHRAAGSTNVIDIHGDLHELICCSCDYRQSADLHSEIALPPRCPECGGLVRPDVVLFGEMLPPAKTECLQVELTTGFDIVFSVGTSSLFHYIMWPVQVAKNQGKFTIEINPSETSVSQLVDVRIPLGASAALSAIWAEFLR